MIASAIFLPSESLPPLAGAVYVFVISRYQLDRAVHSQIRADVALRCVDRTVEVRTMHPLAPSRALPPANHYVGWLDQVCSVTFAVWTRLAILRPGGCTRCPHGRRVFTYVNSMTCPPPLSPPFFSLFLLLAQHPTQYSPAELRTWMTKGVGGVRRRVAAWLVVAIVLLGGAITPIAVFGVTWVFAPSLAGLAAVLLVATLFHAWRLGALWTGKIEPNHAVPERGVQPSLGFQRSIAFPLLSLCFSFALHLAQLRRDSTGGGAPRFWRTPSLWNM